MSNQWNKPSSYSLKGRKLWTYFIIASSFGYSLTKPLSVMLLLVPWMSWLCFLSPNVGGKRTCERKSKMCAVNSLPSIVTWCTLPEFHKSLQWSRKWPPESGMLFSGRCRHCSSHTLRPSLFLYISDPSFLLSLYTQIFQWKMLLLCCLLFVPNECHNMLFKH